MKDEESFNDHSSSEDEEEEDEGEQETATLNLKSRPHARASHTAVIPQPQSKRQSRQRMPEPREAYSKMNDGFMRQRVREKKSAHNPYSGMVLAMMTRKQERKGKWRLRTGKLVEKMD